MNYSYFVTVKIRKHIKISNWAVAGIAGAILLYVGAAGMLSIALPWEYRGDTVQHLGYAWRVHHGDIPKLNDGLENPALINWKGERSDIVTSSANPPLFYVIHSPFVGPLLDHGNAKEAVEVGRGINVTLGIICVLSLAWAGWTFGGRRKELFAVAVPALAGLTYRFVTLNTNYALDALLATFSTLSLITTYKLLKHGPQKKYLIATAALSILGMATKAPYIVFVFTGLFGVVLAYYLHGEEGVKRNIRKGLALSCIIVALVVLAIGWFYYFWNYKTSGNWFRSAPDSYTGGRDYKSLGDVLTGAKLWTIFYADYAKDALLSVSLVSFATAGLLAMDKRNFIKIKKDKALVWMYIIFGLAVAGTLLTQIIHAVGYGAINFRYMLPAILPVTLYLAYGLLEFKNVRGQLVSVFSVSMALLVFFSFFRSNANDLPVILQVIFLLSLIVGAGLLIISLYKLSAPRRSGKTA